MHCSIQLRICTSYTPELKRTLPLLAKALSRQRRGVCHSCPIQVNLTQVMTIPDAEP